MTDRRDHATSEDDRIHGPGIERPYGGDEDEQDAVGWDAPDDQEE